MYDETTSYPLPLLFSDGVSVTGLGGGRSLGRMKRV